MNERIRELAQATDIWCDQNYSGDEFYHLRWEEKFAEMIVQELISKVVNRHPEYFASQALKWQMGCRIKEYFGVDEE